MKNFVREWKQLFLIKQFILFITLSCLSSSAQAVAAASEWPLGPPEEYTMAWINITYQGRNGTLVVDKSQSGRFGKGGKIASASGLVVHVKSIRNGTINHYGCDPIINDVPEYHWIALIKRGMCDFDLKMKNAYERHAVGMVVYDRAESDSLEDMKLTAYTIPGVFTFKSRGERIANISDRGIPIQMSITVGEVCTRPYSGINRTSVLFVSISFIVLMIISLAWLVFYYVQRFRYLHAKDRLAQRLCNAAKKALAKIPTRNIKLSDKEVSGEGECCAVCIEFYKTGDMLRTLPCRHEFHKFCVDPWLLDHRTCPMCKMDILKYYGFIFTGSQESILHLDLEDGGLNSSESIDTNSPSHDNQLSPQYIENSNNQRLDSSTGSLDESSPAAVTIAGFPSSPGETGGSEGGRKPSLLSLTVVATPNGCVTSVTAKCTSLPPYKMSVSETSESLGPSISKKESAPLHLHSASSNFETCNSCVSIPRSSSANTVSESSSKGIDNCSLKSTSQSIGGEKIEGNQSSLENEENEKDSAKGESVLSDLGEETE